MSYLENFNYHLSGEPDQPKLVFLHGLMGSGANWRGVTPTFKADFHILTYDQRGHGRSFRPETGYTPIDYGEDLKKILDELGWEQISLVGHSMGGRNAQIFASMFQERVNKLVIEDVGPEAHPKAEHRHRQLLDLVPTPFPNKKEARRFFNEDFVDKIPTYPQLRVLAEYLYVNIVETESGEADWRFYKPGIIETVAKGHARDYWQELAHLTMPTLVIRGADSNELPSDEFSRMCEINPQIQGIEVADAGHWVHFNQAKEFSRIVYSFLTTP